MLLLCHVEVLHHSTPRSSRVLLLWHAEVLHHSTPRSSRVLLLCHVGVLHHSTPRSSPVCCYYGMSRYCTILPHAPLPCVAIMPCRGIAPFYPTLLSLVLLLCHVEVLHHSTPRSSPLCCYYAMSRYCTILPHAPPVCCYYAMSGYCIILPHDPLPCAAIMPCRGIAPFYPTLLSLVLLLWHAEVLHHSTPRSSRVLLLWHAEVLHHSTPGASPLCCYYGMPRYCTILPTLLPCAAIMPCRGIAPFYPTLLRCCYYAIPRYCTILPHAPPVCYYYGMPRYCTILPHAPPVCCYYAIPRYCTILPHAPPVCCYYAMSRYCTILPHAPLPCAAIMPCRGIAPFYLTLLSLVLLLWHAEVLHHSTHAPLPCAAIMPCRGIAPLYPTLLSLVLLLWHVEVLHHSTPRSSPLCCYYAMPRYCTILPHAPLPCAAIMPCRAIVPFYPTLLSLVLLVCHAKVLHHSTSRSSPLCCYYGMPSYCTILPTLLSLVPLLCHAEVLHHSTPRSSPLCCYYGMSRYCTILPHAPLPCAAIMPCRGIAPFYPTLLSLVLLLCHVEVLHHSTPRSSLLCCYCAMPRYCTILPTLLSLVLLLCHVEVLHHSTQRSSPLCCYYAMPRYCTILPHAPLPCAAIMACRCIAPFYPTLLSLVLLLCHVEVLHHSTPRSSPLCCYYGMSRYCTILPHAPLRCAAIMPCRGIAPFYPTLLSLVLLLCHAEVLYHSTSRSSPLCCYYGMSRYCTILPHAPLPCAAIMPCRGIAPFYLTLLSLVLLLWHAEVLHHSTHAPLPCAAIMPCRGIAPFSSHAPLPCAAIMPCRGIAPFYPTLLSLVLLLCHARYCTILPTLLSLVLLLCHVEVLHHSTPRSSPLCCYYAMPRYCTILPHAPLPCAAIMACRGIAPFYPTLLSLVLLLCHVEVLHHSTPRSSPLCCYYAMSYCTILPHAPLPCAAIMPCRGIAPFYPTLLSLVLLLWHAEVLHHSTHPLLRMPRYCTILPHAPLHCAAIMACRGIAPFYPTLLSLVLLLCHAEVLHHSTPRSSPLCCYYAMSRYCTILPHAPLPHAEVLCTHLSLVLLLCHAEVLHHSTPRSTLPRYCTILPHAPPVCCYYAMPRYCTILPHAPPVCCYYGMPSIAPFYPTLPPLCCYYAMSMYCTILPHAPLPCAAIMPCRCIAPLYPTLLPCAAIMACRGIAPFYPTLLSRVLLLWHGEALHHSTPRSSPLCCYYAMSRYCTIIPHAPPVCCYYAMPRYCTILPHATLPCAAIMPCRGIAPFYPTLLSRLLLLWHVEVLHHSTPRSSRVLLLWHAEVLHHSTPRSTRVLLLWHAEVLHHSTPRSSPLCCYYTMPRYCTILPHAPLPCAAIMPCRGIAPFYPTLLSLVLLLCHAEVLHHSTPRSPPLCCYYGMPRYCTILPHAPLPCAAIMPCRGIAPFYPTLLSLVLLLCHAEVLHHSTSRSSPLCCYYGMPRYCTILHTLLSLVPLLCHAEVLHHSTPRSSPLCCYYGMSRYCTILPHAPLPCAAIMPCRGFAPFYPTLHSLVLLLCHAEVLHHSTPRSSPVCCYYAMSRYCTILPHAPLLCAAIMPCRGIATFYPTLLSLVLLLWHVEVLHHSTPRSSPLCRYYAMPRYCTLLPHAPLPCAAIMPCRCIAPFYHTVLSLVLLLWHAEVLHHSTPRSSRVLLLWHAEVLHHSTPRSSRVLLLWHAEVLHHSTPRSSRVLLLCHAEVLHHSTPRSSPLCCYYAMPRYCTILPHAPPVCCYYGMPRYCTILPHAPPVCCYYAMSGYCIILPHDPLPCAAIMACRGIAPFYPTLLSIVLLLWHVEVLHHSTPGSSPLCCYYAMPRYCTILPHAPLPCVAPLPCAAIILPHACRGIAPFYPTLLSRVLLLCILLHHSTPRSSRVLLLCHAEVLHHSTPRSSRVLLLWHAEVLHHSTPRSSPLCCYYAMPRYCTILPHAPLPLCCYYGMPRYCTILPHAPPVCCYYGMPRYCTILPHAPPVCCYYGMRGIAPFYPTLLSLVLLLYHAEVLHHSTPRSSPVCCYYAMPRYCTILPHAPLPCAAIMPCRGIAPFYPTLPSLVLLLWHAEVLHHSTPRSSPLCCYYAMCMPRYCTILPHAPLPCAAIMAMPRYCTILPHAPLPCAAIMACRGIAPFYPTLLSLVLLLCHAEVLHHSTPRSSPLCCYYAMPRYCTILPHAPLPCAAIMACRGIAPFYPTLLSLVLLLCHAEVLHHSTPRSSPLCCYYAMPRYCTILPHAPSLVLLLCHAEVLHHSTPRSLPCAAIMPCRGIAPFYPTLLSLVLLLCHAEVLHHSTPRSSPLCCYYAARYCTIARCTIHPCAAIMPCRGIAPFYPTLLPCAAIMPCRGIAPFYPTLLSLVLLLCHAEVLHHSTPRSSPLCCYYAMSRYCTILPHAPLPCAAIMACRGIAPFYPTLLPCAAIMACRGIAPFYPTLLSLVLLLCHAEVLHHSTPRSSRVLLLCHAEVLHHSTPRSSRVLLLCHAEVLHHSTPRSSPLCCYYAMSRYCTILPHAPLPCCYYAMPMYCTIIPHAPPVCCYYGMPRYCTILPHAPPVCCYYGRGIAPFYPTLLSLVLLLYHAEVLHHSTPRSSPVCCYYAMPRYCTILPHAPPVCCYYAMPRYCTILPHAPLPCAAIMACRGIAPFYPTLLSLVLLLCHAEVLHHSTPRSSPVCCYYGMPRYCTILPHAPPVCCYYAMSRYCTILPHATLLVLLLCHAEVLHHSTPRSLGIAPFYPTTLLSLVLLLCHAEVLHHSTPRSSPCAAIVLRGIAPFYPRSSPLCCYYAMSVLHHSTPRSSPLCCYYAMPRYCTILPHAPLPCAAIMACRGIAPFYPTLLSLVLLLCHVEVLHHSTPRSSPLCCYYGMSRYCTILPHAPLPCAAIMPCRGIAPFYPTLLSLVLLLCHAEVLHHSTPRSSPLCCYYAMHHSTPRYCTILPHAPLLVLLVLLFPAMPRYCTILPHAPLPCAAIMLLCHAEVLHHSTPRSSPLCCYYAMPRYCTILPHALLSLLFCAAIMPCRGIAPFYPTLLSLVLLLCHAEVLHHSTPRSSPLCCYYGMPRYCTILPHAPRMSVLHPCAAIMPCRGIAPFYPTLLSLVLLLWHAEVLHHSTSSPLCCYYAMSRYCTILPHAPLPCAAIMPCRGIAPFYPTLLSLVLLLSYPTLLSLVCCYYGMSRYCTILPHAPLPCAAIMPCRGIAPFYPTLLSLVLLLCHAEVLYHSTHAPLPCAAIMACRGIAPFYPTLLSLVLLLWHAEVLHHSTPRSSPLCCYYAMPRYCTILPHAPLPCAAIMPCRGIAPFYPTLLSLVLLLWHVEVLHHSTPRSSPLCCYYAMPRYCTILPHAPLPCAAIMPCRGIAPFYPTLLSLVLLLCHAEVLHHSTPRSSPLCCYYAMSRYCTILPHAPLPCAVIMPCRGIAPFYPTLPSLVLLLWHAEVLHHSTPRSSPLCCYYAMSRYCTILPHAPLPCAAIMPCRAIVPFYPTLLSLVLLLCHAEVLHHSTSRSSPLCCYYGMPRYCTILPTLLSLVPLLCHAEVLHHSTPRSSPLCCYYGMSRYCTILPHAPLPCAAIMPCRGIAPFYPTLLSLVLLLCHVEVLHHSTPRSSPLCCYYGMPRYCTILPHAPLPCVAIMPCRDIAPFYPTLHPCAAIMPCRGIAPFYPTLHPCAAIMPCRGIAPFYPTLLPCAAIMACRVLHHSTPRSSPLCCYYAMSMYCTILPHAPLPVCCYYAIYPTLLPCAARYCTIIPHAPPVCCYYGMPRYCTILPHAPLPCAAIMPCRGIAPFYPTLLPCAAIMACRGIAPFYPTLLSLVLLLCHAEVLHHSTPRSLPCAAIMACRGIAPFYPTLLSLVLLLYHAEVLHHSTPRSTRVLLLCHAEVLHHSTPRSSPLCCYYTMPRYCTILPHAPLPCAAIMPCRGIAPFYPTLLSLVLLLCHAEVLHHSTPRSPPLCCYYGMPRYCTILPHAPLPCAAIMPCRGIAPFYPTLLSLVLLLCHVELLYHSTPRSSPLCCYYAMPRYCTILPHAPLPCAAIMACRGIAPFYPRSSPLCRSLLSLVLLLCHAEVFTILPHAPLPCVAIMPCRGIAPFYPTLLSLVLLLWHAEVLHHSTPRSSPLCCYYAMPMYCTILPHAPPVCCYYAMPRYCTILPHAPPVCCYYAMPRYCTILPQAPPVCCYYGMPSIAPFYPTLLSLVLLLCHVDVLHHSTSRSSPLCCYYAMPMYCTIIPHAPPVCCYYGMPRYCTIMPHAPPVCCYYGMPRYCTILPHAPLPCAAIMPCRGIAPFYPTLLPCAAIMPCRGIAPFYPTLLPCAAIMPCRGIAPFYPTLLSRLLLLWHVEVLHHSTPRSSPVCCYYGMPRYCTILPHAPPVCCYYGMPRYCTILPHALSLVLLLWHAEVLHHSTPRSSRVLLLCHAEVLHHSTPRSSRVLLLWHAEYCTILPHAPLPCAAIMPCRCIAPFYHTLLSLVLLLCHADVLHHSTPRSSLVLLLCHAEVLHHSTPRSSRVLLLWHGEVLHHSTPRSSPLCCYYAMSRYCTIIPHAPPVCCYYGMPRYCTILPHAPLPCAAIMPCRGIAPFYPTLLSRLLLLWHAEVLHHSTPRSSRVLLLCHAEVLHHSTPRSTRVLLLWHAEVLHHSTPRSSPLCCYYTMPRYCTILPHAPLPCAAIMPCRGIAPFYPTLLSLVLLLCHAEVLHHSTPRSPPLCCYYGMPRYCTILPHAPLPCAAIMPCRGIAPFYPTLLSLVLLLCHVELLYHSTPRSSPLCCYYAMPRYCTILPHAPLPCAAIMACRGIAPFYPRSSPLCRYYAMPRYCTILPHAPLHCAAIMACRGIAPFYPTLLSLVLLLCHAEVLHHSTPRSTPLCCYYAMSRYCTILPHAPLPCVAIMACRGIAPFYPTLLSLVLLLCHAEVLHHSTPRSTRVLLLCHAEVLHHSTPRSTRVLLLCHAEVLHHSTPGSSRVLLLWHAEYCTILPHAPLPCAAIMPCRCIAPFYHTLLSLTLLLCHADVLHHYTPRSSRVLLLWHAEVLHHYAPRSSRVLLLWHAEALHHSTTRSSPLCCYYAMPMYCTIIPHAHPVCCYYGMPRYCTIMPHAPPVCCYYGMPRHCTILPHAPLPCAAIMPCRGIAPLYPTLLPCAAIMPCRGIAPFYPTLLSLVLLLCHAEVLHHSTPRSSPVCCYYGMSRYCTILPHAPLVCCYYGMPRYCTILPHAPPVCCYYGMRRYCTILTHAPLPCAAIIPCRGIAPFYPTLLSRVLLLCHAKVLHHSTPRSSRVLLLWHAEVLHHSTPRSSPLCCYYAMPSYCTILPHAPPVCCYYAMSRYCTHSTPRSSPVCCYYAMPRYCTILPHAPLPCAAIMPCRGIAPFYPTLLSLVLLLCHAEVLHHSTPRSSPVCCYYAMPRYCTILPHAPLPCAAIMPCRGIAPFYPTLLSLVLLLCHAEVLHLLPCAAIMPCRGIAPFYPTLLSLVLLLCHAEVLHHSTPRSSPLCCYYAMPRYCTILPHAPLPCAAIMPCRGIAPFYPTLLSLVLLLWHAEVLHHSTPRSSPLCCYYAMPRYCTILPHAPLPCAAIMPCRGIAPLYPTLLPCAAIMPCRGIAPFYPTLLSLVLLLCHAEVLHHSTPRSSPVVLLLWHVEVLHHSTPRSSRVLLLCMPRYCTILPHATRVLLLWHAEVLHHSTPRSSPLCCYYTMPRYCTILPHAPLPCAAIMPCRGIAPFYPTLLSRVLLLCHAEVLHHSTPRSSPLCCYYAMPRYCTILPHALRVLLLCHVLLLWHVEVLHHSTPRSSPVSIMACRGIAPFYPAIMPCRGIAPILPHAPLPCAAIMPCRGIAPFYHTVLSLVLLLYPTLPCAEVLHHSTPRSSRVLLLWHAEVLHHSTPRSSPLCCYYVLAILPHAPLPCAAIMPHHSTTRSSPLCCYYGMPRYCTILPHAPPVCCYYGMPRYCTILPHAPPVCCYYGMPRYCTILPHAPPVCCSYAMLRYCTILPHAPLPCVAIMPCRGIAPFYPTLLPCAAIMACRGIAPFYPTLLPCAAIMPCRGIAPFYPTILSRVLLLWHVEVLHHSTPRSSPLCCYYAMPRYCSILPHAPLPCAAIMPCRGIAPFYPTLLSLVLLLCHVEVLHHSTPRSSRVLLLCHVGVLHHSTPRSSPLCCYYAMSRYCTILPHAPLPCAAIMPCRGIAPFYPTLHSLVLLLCHVEVLHHSTPRSSPLCCYYGMPRYCTILPHAPLPCVAIMPCRGIAPFYPTLHPCAAIMPCRGIAPFYPTLHPCAAIMPCRGIAPFYPRLLPCAAIMACRVLHHSTPRSSPLCCYYAMSMYCTILPHAPLPYAAIMPCRCIAPLYPTLLPCAAIMACRGIAPLCPTLLPCAAIMACRGIAPFYPTLLSLVLLLCHVEVLHHYTPRSSRVLLLCHAEVLHHSTPRYSPLCCYYAMPRYCTILPHAPLPFAAIMACRGIAPFYPTLLSCAAIMACRGIAPFYPTLHPCAAIMACGGIAPF